jgi:hypothetical protein
MRWGRDCSKITTPADGSWKRNTRFAYIPRVVFETAPGWAHFGVLEPTPCDHWIWLESYVEALQFSKYRWRPKYRYSPEP